MSESLVVRGKNTENCLQKRNSVGLTEWKFSPTSTPRVPLGEVFLSVPFHSCEMLLLWALIWWGSQRPKPPGWSSELDHLWKQFWRIFPWGDGLAHSVSHQGSWLQTVNHWLCTYIFLLPPPTYWSWTAVLSSRCFWGESVWGKRQHNLTEKAQFCWQTDLRGSTTYQLCGPWSSCSLSLSLGKWSPLYLFFRAVSFGRINGNYMHSKMMSHVPGTQWILNGWHIPLVGIPCNSKSKYL